MNEVSGPASSSKAVQSTKELCSLRITSSLLLAAALSTLASFDRLAVVFPFVFASTHDAFTYHLLEKPLGYLLQKPSTEGLIKGLKRKRNVNA